MNFKTFSSKPHTRISLWTLADQVLKARKKSRPMMHTLLNLLAQKNFLTGIITTNIDGLEIMDKDLLPEVAKGYAWTDENWLRHRPDLLLALHGTITRVYCNHCKGHSFDLDSESVIQLIKDTYPPCEYCSQSRNGRNASTFWRPDITFYDDTQEGLQAESYDEEYFPNNEERKKAQTRATCLDKADRYKTFMSHSDLINSIFIVGSSLSSKQLKSDIFALIKGGTQAFVINPQPPSQLGGLSNCTWVKIGAEEFAEFIYSHLT